MTDNRDQYLWVEQHRPHSIEQTILPTVLKQTFSKIVDSGKVPNLLLTGAPGCGKTTVARAMLDQLELPYLFLNAQIDANMDKLRTDIREYASSTSISGKRKYIILDEADYLSHHIQPALRGFIEEYAKTCGFILTCNFKNKLIEPLHSRFSIIEFNFKGKDAPDLAKQMFTRTCEILNQHQIEYDKKVVVELIRKYYPDFRRLLNEIQAYSIGGKIDSGILSTFSDNSIKAMIEMMKDNNFTGLKKWVAENDVDDQVLFRKLYDIAEQYVNTKSVAAMVMILAKYQYQAAFAADKQINLLACLVELMVDMEWL
jgi:DNA polymerase III delta prime subunit